MRRIDYVTGSIMTALYILILGLSGWLYWSLHGGSIQGFSFWIEGDMKWLEVLFWSFFTALAWQITYNGSAMWGDDATFRFDWVWWSTGRVLEAPLISVALVFVMTSLGVAFGEVTLSLQETPITVVIALAIIATYFAEDTVAALKAVAVWFKKRVESGLSTDAGTPASPK